jgi:hypothetical protein
MGSTTAAGSSLAISAGSPATQDATGYAALTFTEVAGIDKIGALGAQFAKVDFQPLKGPKEKYKGSVDNGSLAPSMANNEDDAGQTLMRTAAADKTNKIFSFLVTYPTGAKRYFGGRVFGFPETTDGADSIQMATPTVEVCTEIVKVAAA